MTQKYYSTDVTISIGEIVANSKEEADKLISEFVAKIIPLMADKIRWEEADWEVEENVLNEVAGIWEVAQ